MSDAFERIDPPELGEPKGWTNGLLAPPGARVLFIAGQTAARGDERDLAGRSMAEQWRSAIQNVLAVLHAAGGTAEQIARMTIFVTDLDAYRAARRDIGRVWQQHLGSHYPAMALVEVSGLLDPGAVLEIEATAIL